MPRLPPSPKAKRTPSATKSHAQLRKWGGAVCFRTRPDMPLHEVVRPIRLFSPHGLVVEDIIVIQRVGALATPAQLARISHSSRAAAFSFGFCPVLGGFRAFRGEVVAIFLVHGWVFLSRVVYLRIAPPAGGGLGCGNRVCFFDSFFSSARRGRLVRKSLSMDRRN